MTNIKVFSAESEFEITCLADEKNDSESRRAALTVKQASNSSRALIRPAEHSATVQVHCEVPKSIKLTWAQLNNTAVSGQD